MDEKEEPQELLFLVWVHGFKGNDVSFEGLPDRIVRILEDTHKNLRIQSQVFPAYETRGELSAATENFVEWLATKVVQLENNSGKGGGAGSAKVVLMGHSMGGLLIADAAARIGANTRQGDPLWPNVVATIAYDTPYLGLHPHVFKHHLSQAASHVETARSVASNLALLSPLAVGFGFGKPKPAEDAAASRDGSRGPTPPKEQTPPQDVRPGASSWWRTPSTNAVMGMGALALGAAAAGTAYYRRQDLATGWKWGFDHMTFVKNLWDAEGLQARLVQIHDMSTTRNVRFANFYTSLPAKDAQEKRTFAILPSKADPTARFWIPAPNTRASDEVAAHMGMFNPTTNDGFYDLGLSIVRMVGSRIEEEGVKRTPAAPTPRPEEQVQVIDLLD